MPAPKWAAPIPDQPLPSTSPPKSHNHCAEELVGLLEGFLGANPGGFSAAVCTTFTRVKVGTPVVVPRSAWFRRTLASADGHYAAFGYAGCETFHSFGHVEREQGDRTNRLTLHRRGSSSGDGTPDN